MSLSIHIYIYRERERLIDLGSDDQLGCPRVAPGNLVIGSVCSMRKMTASNIVSYNIM